MSTAEQITRLRARMVASRDPSRAARLLASTGLTRRHAEQAVLALRTEIRRARAGGAA